VAFFFAATSPLSSFRKRATEKWNKKTSKFVKHLVGWLGEEG